MAKCGELYIVSTPIGNLEDITLRALRVLKEVDCIAAEDTRHSRKLLTHYEIKTPLIAYHQHNRKKGGEKLLRMLQEGNDIAQIADAGTPGVSDPGTALVEMALERGISPIIIPGPCAAVAALAVSGLPTARFLFAGALPHRPSARRERLEKLKNVELTLIFYLSPHRLKAELADIYRIMGERMASLAREITKKFEEFTRKPLAQLIDFVEQQPIRGEYTLILAGRPPSAAAEIGEAEVEDMLCELVNEKKLSKKEAVAMLARELNLPKRKIYKVGIKICPN